MYVRFKGKHGSKWDYVPLTALPPIYRFLGTTNGIAIRLKRQTEILKQPLRNKILSLLLYEVFPGYIPVINIPQWCSMFGVSETLMEWLFEQFSETYKVESVLKALWISCHVQSVIWRLQISTLTSIRVLSSRYIIYFVNRKRKLYRDRK